MSAVVVLDLDGWRPVLATDRVWRVGEPFEAMAKTFLPGIRPARRSPSSSA